MNTMTKDEALAERERLEAERDRARELLRSHAEQRTDAAERLRTMPPDRAKALQEQARTGEPADVDRLDAEERDLAATVKREGEAAAAARVVWEEAKTRIRDLHYEQAEAFFENAEILTAEVEAKREATRERLAEIHVADERARSEWERLIRDYNHQLAARMGDNQKAAGELKRRSLSQPPASPFPSPAELDAAPPVRPPEIEPLGEGGKAA